MTVRKRRCSIVVRKEELNGKEHSRKVGITEATGQQWFRVEQVQDESSDDKKTEKCSLKGELGRLSLVTRKKFQWEEGQESPIQGVGHRQDGGEGKCRLPLQTLGPEAGKRATSILETQRRELFLSGWCVNRKMRGEIFLRWVIGK